MRWIELSVKLSQETLSRTKETGCMVLSSAVRQAMGLFLIVSNNAVLRYGQGKLTVRTDTVPFRGSFISATIDYLTERLLEKAFVFNGKVHEPEHDYIDMHYQQLGDKIVFEVAKEVEGFGNRGGQAQRDHF
jgi:hypothetical protein